MPLNGSHPEINLWEGRHEVFGPDRYAYKVGGYFVTQPQGNQGETFTYPLTISRLSSITATSHFYDTGGHYYTGPSIMNTANGKPLIRLDHATKLAMGGKETIGPPSIDPNQCELHIFPEDGYFLRVQGSHLVIEGLKVRYTYCAIALVKNSQGGYPDHVTIKNGHIWGGRILIRTNGATNWTIDNMILDGLMDPARGHLSWGEIKGGAQIAKGNRTQCIDAGTGENGQVIRSKLCNAFDGITGGGKNLQVGGFAERTGVTIEEWDAACRALGNHFDKIWDDAHQISPTQRNLIHNHNLYTGAGLSRDGDGGPTSPGRPISLFNIFDSRKCKIFLFRTGRTVANSGQTGEGLRHPRVLGYHGSSQRPFPWIKVHDTEIWGYDLARAEDGTPRDQAKGLFHYPRSADLSELQQSEINLEFNSIVIDQGAYTGDPNNLDRLNAHTRHWAGVHFTLDSTSGKEIRDGNLIVNFSGPKVYQRFVETSSGAVESVKTVAELSALVFADSNAYYPGGIDGKSSEINIGQVSDVVNSDYIPVHAEARNGAVDMTLLLAFLPPRLHQAFFARRGWRGAIPPS